MGRQNERQEKDKTREADRASQTRWETSWETRPETAQRGGHSIPAKMADKTGDKTADKRKTRPARRTQHPSHSFPCCPKTYEYRLQEFQSPKLDPKERIRPYTVLSHPLKIANRLCILILWNTICVFQSSQWRSTDMLARSGARSSILWHLWPAMAVLVSIGLSFLSISILGMFKYLEKPRSSNEYRNLNLRNYIPKKG